MKALLCLPYGTAAIERGFAERDRIKTADRNRLMEDTMSHLMMVRSNKRKIDAYQFLVRVEFGVV